LLYINAVKLAVPRGLDPHPMVVPGVVDDLARGRRARPGRLGPAPERSDTERVTKKRRAREQTFAEIADRVRSEVEVGGTWHGPRPDPTLEGSYTDDDGVTWGLRRRVGLRYSQATKLLPVADVMLFDSFPFGETRSVPVDERAAVLESAEDGWEAYDFQTPGSQGYGAYEFNDESGRRMLYLQHWYN
jgi:hypothetical protein